MCFTHSSATRSAFNYLPELQTQQHEGQSARHADNKQSELGDNLSLLWGVGGVVGINTHVVLCCKRYESPRCQLVTSKRYRAIYDVSEPSALEKVVFPPPQKNFQNLICEMSEKMHKKKK